MKISQNCLELIEKWESLFLDAYLDPVGIPTIGYGTIRYPNGQKVKMGDSLTTAEAEAYLNFEVEEIVKSLEGYLKGINLNQNQFDAIVSLCYNIGVGGFSGSTILKKLKTGDFDEAAAAFELWNKGTVGGVKKVLPGLVNRRREERALFEKSGGEGTPIENEESPQDKVTLLEGYRDGENNIIVAFEGTKVVEILELKTSFKEDLITIIQQYKNAKSFQIAPADKKIPAGTRVEVVGKGADIPPAADKPTLERKLLIIGISDDDPGIKGSDVKEMQQRLLELGYYKGKIDGIFGKGTDAAVKDFQADCFGIGEADGKVGKITWEKLWDGQPSPVLPPPPPTGTSTSKKNYLLLTKTSVKDTSGCYKLKLDYFKAGKLTDSILVVSGIPKRQFFRKGKDSIRNSYEPLPEGKWLLQDIEFADGKDNYNGKTYHDKGLGPAKIRMDYVPVNGTNRSAIEIHIDWNKSTSPGTAGCIGVNSISDFKRLVTWLRETDPRDLYVDWGLGSVKLP